MLIAIISAFIGFILGVRINQMITEYNYDLVVKTDTSKDNTEH